MLVLGLVGALSLVVELAVVEVAPLLASRSQAGLRKMMTATGASEQRAPLALPPTAPLLVAAGPAGIRVVSEA